MGADFRSLVVLKNTDFPSSKCLTYRERGGAGPLCPRVLHADAGRVPRGAGHLAAAAAAGVGIPLGQGHHRRAHQGPPDHGRQTEGK